MLVADSTCVKVAAEFMPNVRDIALMPLYDKLFDLVNPPRFVLFRGSRVPPSVVRRREQEDAGSSTPSGPPGHEGRLGHRCTRVATRVSAAAASETRDDRRVSSMAYLAQRHGARPVVARMTSWKTVQNLVAKDELVNKQAGDVHEGIRDRFPLEVWKLLKKESPGLCRYWEQKLKRHDSLAGTEKVKIGVRWIDVYVWAVLLGNHELALVLLPKCREPLRAAIIGVRLFKAMARRLPLHHEALEGFALEHEAWATHLLDFCDVFETARHMLTCPSATFEHTVIQTALQTGCRKCECARPRTRCAPAIVCSMSTHIRARAHAHAHPCRDVEVLVSIHRPLDCLSSLVRLAVCAHAHCQALCDEILRGNLDPHVPQLVLPVHYLRGFLSACRLVAVALVPIDLAQWRPVEWTQPDGMADEEMEEEYMAKVKFLDTFYGIPTVKLQLRLVCYLLYVLFVSIACVATNTDTYHAIEDDPRMSAFHRGGGIGDKWTALTLLLWTIANGLDQWHQFSKSVSTLRGWWGDWWSRFDCLTIAGTLVALSMRFYSTNLSLDIMSFVVICIWFRMYKYFATSHDVGPLVVMISHMLNDLVVWFQVTAIIVGAFMVAFVAISDPLAVAESDETPLTVPLWSLFNIFEPTTMYSFNPRVGAPLLFLYNIIVLVVMLNLLLAMLATTYGEIQGHAEEVWKMERLRTALVAVERWSDAPPPLNLPWTLAALCRSLCTWCVYGWRDHSDWMSDELTREKVKEAKVTNALSVEGLLLKMRCEQDVVDETNVPAIVRDIAFDVDVLGDKANLLVQDLKVMKEMQQLQQETQPGTKREKRESISLRRRRSSAARLSQVSLEMASRRSVRRVSRAGLL